MAMVRWTPKMPPTPSRVKPNPSCTAVNVTEIEMTRDQFPCPSKSVSRIPAAEMPMPIASSWTTPAYSPRSGSRWRKPPPTTTPASMTSPSPVGGTKEGESACTRPRLPRPSAGSENVTPAPIPRIVAATGPMSNLKSPVAETLSPSPSATISTRRASMNRNGKGEDGAGR
jgi:hypothetical protein